MLLISKLIHSDIFWGIKSKMSGWCHHPDII